MPHCTSFLGTVLQGHLFCTFCAAMPLKQQHLRRHYSLMKIYDSINRKLIFVMKHCLDRQPSHNVYYGNNCNKSGNNNDDTINSAMLLMMSYD